MSPEADCRAWGSRPGRVAAGDLTNDPGRDVCLPVNSADVVSFRHSAFDGHAQDRQQRQAWEQNPSTETDRRQLAVLDGARHRAHVDAEHRDRLSNRQDGDRASAYELPRTCWCRSFVN
jgi:hypothetical protein